MSATRYDRRAFVAYFSSIGLGSTLVPGVLWAKLHESAGGEITKETIGAAEEIAGVSFTDEQRQMMVRGLQQLRQGIDALHKVPLDNTIAPAIVFDPVPPGATLPAKREEATVRAHVPVMARPSSLEDLAFHTVAELSTLVRARRVKSRELTDMYLARLERFDPKLHCVITLTKDRARAHANAADAEIAAGKYRGPLHGIPWGAKDLLAAKGYLTTWGAGPYKNQMLDYDAEVVRRLDNAGAILVAKLTLGELAQGDRWFGETTRNPWWPEQGSSGSSAGPASATAAGLVGFSIGTETQGSISSPSTRCGVSGLRPTFGRVPRTGAMALSWSMDKIGPICRSAEDCALVLDAIAGPDGQDLSVRHYPFNWNASRRPSSLRVGYLKSAFDQPERDPANPQRGHFTKSQDDAALAVLEKLGVKLIPIELPDMSTQPMSMILSAEAGAAFDELTRSGRVDEMVQQNAGAWPNTFRSAHFIPAVEYINANRARTLLCQRWWDLFKNIDVLVTPTGGSNQLGMTNLTGNPAVIVPHGFREAQGPTVAQIASGAGFGGGGRGAAPSGTPSSPASTPAAAPSDTSARRAAAPPPPTEPRPQTPVSITFLGPLFQEENPLLLAHAFQQSTDFHRRRPPGF
jgi:Asp-tRNA(Asn)/Glu-tRNA(Gln) amidotransferase A subunit family amidase